MHPVDSEEASGSWSHFSMQSVYNLLLMICIQTGLKVLFLIDLFFRVQLKFYHQMECERRDNSGVCNINDLLPCLVIPVSDYESVRINNLCHKMTLHIIYILYTIFEDGKGYVIYGLLQRFYGYTLKRCYKWPPYIFVPVQKKSLLQNVNAMKKSKALLRLFKLSHFKMTGRSYTDKSPRKCTLISKSHTF